MEQVFLLTKSLSSAKVFDKNTSNAVINFKKITGCFFFSIFILLMMNPQQVFGQTAVPSTTPVVQNFDAIAATLVTPANWKMAAGASPTYTGGTTAISIQASSGAPATGGTYNWGAGATDRALGAMTSGSFASPNNVIGYYRNTNAGNLTSLTIAYDLERYRINTAAASVQFFYSLDGSTWLPITAGDIAAASLPTGVNAYSFAPSGVPSATVAGVINKTGISITGLNIATNGDFYLRWNLNTTGANSQGIGIDNVSVTAAFAASATPTITSYTPAFGCAGTSITIVGTNLTGATAANVKIGTTAVSSISSNDGSNLVAVLPSVATATTGAVSVTIGANTATGLGTFTINPVPADPGTPTSNSPQCVSPGVTLTRNGTPAGGITWYWQTASTGTTISPGVNDQATFIVSPGATYYIRSYNGSCWGAGAASIAVTTIPAVPTVTNPLNITTEVGGNATFGVSASNTPNASGYIWEVNKNDGNGWNTVTNGGVYSTATTSSLTISGATLDMNNYQYRATATNLCGSSVASSPATLTVTYCTPVYTTGTGQSDIITNITYAGINNSTGGAASPFYSFFSTPVASVTQTVASNFTITVNATGGNEFVGMWIDYNDNGIFESGERLINNVPTVGFTLTQPVTVPVTAATGTHRMRVRISFDTHPNIDPCASYTWGETEDYLVNIVALSAPSCVTSPTSPADATTGVALSGTTLTWANPGTAADYDVYFSTDPLFASPSDKVATQQSATTYTTGALLGTTTYYWKVVPHNGGGYASGCTSVWSFATVNVAVNDECTAATKLTVNSTPACTSFKSDDLQSASQSLAPITCGANTSSFAYDEWFQFKASASGNNVVTVTPTGFDAVVDVRNGACNGTTIACADANGSGVAESISLTGLTSGATYFVRVYERTATTPSGSKPFTICVAAPCPAYPAVSINSPTRCGAGDVTFTVNDPGTGYSVEWSNNGSTVDNTVTGFSNTKTLTAGTSVDVWVRFSYTAYDPYCKSAWVKATGTASQPFSLPGLAITESMGTVSGTTTIAAHETANGFDNDAFTMTGTGDLRNTTISSGYTGASGGANVFLTTTGSPFFQIEGINTSGANSISLSFGVFKSTTAATGSDLIVEYSTDGSAYSALSYPALPTGTGTAAWALRTVTTAIPSASNLRIRFRNTGATSTQYRIDDISISSAAATDATIASAGISAGGPTTFCSPGSVTLTAYPGASSYLWSTGQTSQSITVSSAGSYTATLSVGGCSAVSNAITVSTVSPPNSYNVSGGGSFCTPGNYISLSSSQFGLSYKLYRDGIYTGTTVTGDGTPLTFGTISASGTYTVVADNGTCSISMDNSAAIILLSAPVITCPANITVNNPAGACGANVSFAATATGSPTPGITYSANSGDFFPVGTTTVTATAQNGCGESSCSFTITVKDAQAPTATCQNLTVNLSSSGTAGITASQIDNNSFDNCGAITLAASRTSFTCSDVINIPAPTDLIISEYIEGSASNKLLELYNGTASAIDLSKYNLNLYSNGGITPATVTLSGSLAAGATIVYKNSAQTIYAGTATNLNTVINYNGNDAVALVNNVSGNFVDIFGVIGSDPGTAWTGTGGYTTVDKTLRRKPNVTSGVKVNPSGTGAGAFTTLTTEWDLFATDVASGLGSHTISSGSGSVPVTLTVTDATGNSSTCSASVTVKDVTAPVVPALADVTGECSATATVPSATDNCSGTITGTTTDPLTYNTQGTHTITWSFKDASGNTSTASQSVIVKDVTPPAISCPSNVSSTTSSGGNGDCNGTATWTAPVGTDNCSGSTTALVTATGPGGSFPIGINTVTYKVTDVAGTTTTCSFTVTISDNEKPTISCPADVSVFNTSGQCNKQLTINAPLTDDNCSVSSVSNSFNGTSDASGEYNVGTTNIVWTVTDAAGNSSSCTENITVTDNEAPQISCPLSVTLNTDPGMPYGTITIVDATATDNCGVSTIESDHASPRFAIGSTTVTWTATDIHGNTSTCTQSVFVNDGEEPFIACADNVTVDNDPGQCAHNSVTIGIPYSSDNSGHVTLTVDYPGIAMGPYTQVPVTEGGPYPHPTLVADFPVGTTVLTWTSTDPSGNSTSCLQTVTVLDNESPTITCPSDITKTNDAGFCSALTDIGTPVSADNCGVKSVSNDHPSSTYSVGTTIVTWTVTDLSNHTATCTQQVTVTDDQAPSIMCPADVSVTADANSCAATGVALGSATADDNCGVQSTTNDGASSYAVGTTTVTWTVTDIHGHTAACTQTVTVTDDQAPTITCPADVSVTADANSCSATGVALGSATADDNCGVQSTTNDGASSYAVGTTTVTWTVTDIHGHTAECTQLVTVTDDQAPTITCPADVSVTADANSCSATGVALGSATADDNCGVQSTTNDGASSYAVGTTTVTWTVTDIHGLTGVCSQLVTVTDDQAPTITCPADVSVTADANSCAATGVALGSATADDNCGVQSTTNDGASSYAVGTTTVTWTVTDIHGHTAACTQTVTVTDDQAPTITCPADVSVTADANSCSATGVALGSATADDNCGVQSTSNDGASSYAVGTSTVTWTVTDIHGHTAECTQLVTVTDDQAPTITCPADVSVTADANSCAATGVDLGIATTNDNCGIQSTSNDGASSYTVGTTTVTWTVTDIHGLTGVCTQLVTVTDDQAPTITCPADVSVTADANSCAATGVALGSATADDNCGVQSTTNDGASSYAVGTTTVTWTVTDIHGHTAACTQTVTVTDDQAPSITCPAAISVNNTAGECQAEVALKEPATGDNCGVATVSNDHPSAIYPVGSTDVTWTVLDIHGNTNSCIQTVTVTDNEVPTIACSADVSVNNDPGVCEAQVTLTAPATADNCGVASVTNDHASNVYAVGTTTVTWIVTDIHGNNNTCTQNITVTDDESPVIRCANNVNVNTDATFAYATVSITLRQPSVSDNCDIDDVSSDHPSPRFPIGTTVVTWTATDIHGNTSSCTQTIQVNDAEAPVIICGGSLTANSLPGQCNGDVTLMIPFAHDNSHHFTLTVNYPGITLPTYNPTPTTENDPNAPRPTVIANFPVGETILTWTATDSAGNSSSCTQTITIIDNENPTITCAANVSVNNDGGQCSAQVNLTPPAATDNCGIATVSNDHPSNTYPVGTTTVTWTATDLHGNTAICTQTVVVTDNEAPTIGCSANVSVNNDNGQCSAAITLTPPSSSDNCGVAGVTNNHASNVYAVGTTTVTWTVTDVHGNSASCSQVVSVTDNEKPTINCPVNTTIGSNSGCNATGITLAAPSAGDNCSVASVLNNHPLTTYPKGVTIVKWTVTDASGNTATCTQTVTVIDNVKPTISCPSDILVTIENGDNNWHKNHHGQYHYHHHHHSNGGWDNNDNEEDGDGGNNGCSAIVALGTPVVADNCGLAGVTNNHPGNIFPIGVTTVIWTVTDASGNTATCSQTVTIADSIAPVINNCPQNKTAKTNNGCTATNVNIGSPDASDNCGITSITNNQPDNTYPIGTTTVVWIVSDAWGNTDICTQTVTVKDDDAPTISCPSSQTFNTNSGCSATGVILITPPASDNCTVASVTNNHPGSTYPLGSSEIKWTVTDAAGNTGTCTQRVLVVDNVKPTISCPANKTVTTTSNNCNANGVNIGSPNTSDNCSIDRVSNNHPSNTYPAGTTTVLWTVTDNSGNSSTCSQTVTVNCSGHLVNPNSPIAPSSSLRISTTPNPFSNELHLNVTSIDNKTPVSIRIFDATGVMLEDRNDVSYDSGDMLIGKSLPKGVYLIQVTQGKDIQVQRVVKLE